MREASDAALRGRRVLDIVVPNSFRFRIVEAIHRSVVEG
jgi:hypothetical protein